MSAATSYLERRIDVSLAVYHHPGTLRLVRSRSMDDVTKTCTKCGQSKPLDEFYNKKRSNGTVGKNARCNVCCRSDTRAWAESNPKKARESARLNHAKHRDARLAKMREYAEANRDKLRRDSNSFYAANRERILAKSAARGDARKSSALRRAKKFGAPVFVVTLAEIMAVLAQPCAVCGSTDRIELDHIIPFARGGAHSIGNLQPLCRSCNRAKRDRTMTEFRMWLRRVEEVA